MVKIEFSPIVKPGRLESVTVEGYALTVNGQAFDFSPLEPGHELPCDAIGSDLFAGDAIMSADGGLSVKLLMPYDEATATQAIRFPEPVIVTEDGPVDIPTDHPAEPVHPPMPAAEDNDGLHAE